MLDAAFATGTSTGRTTGSDYATVASSAAIGRRLWIRHYSSTGNYDEVASAVAVGPGGARVFVTGQSMSRTTGYDFATVAYSG